MGYFVTVISIVGITMPLVVTAMFAKNPDSHQHVAFTLMINTVPPSILAAICFYVAGIDFAKEMEIQNKGKIECLAAAIVEVPEVAKGYDGIDYSLL